MPKINPNNLIWAREKAGYTLREAATAFGVSEEKLAEWESGKLNPPRGKLLLMSNKYHIPLTIFYISRKPVESKPIEDFRTLPNKKISPKEEAWVKALVRKIKVGQNLINSALEDEDEAIPISFVGSIKITDSTKHIIESIKENIEFDLEFFRQKKQAESFNYLRAQIEKSGIFVLLQSNLGSHHTDIDPELFRGFCLADPVSPFIVINSKDHPAAWSFTLLHELVHVFLGNTGISSKLGTGIKEKKTEKLCNDIASNILLPHEELSSIKMSTLNKSTNEIVSFVSNFAEKRNLSNSMVSYRMYCCNMIEKDLWLFLNKEFYTKWKNKKSEKKEKSKGKQGGPSYYVLKKHQIGTPLIRVVKRMMAEGALSTTKAAKILDVNARNIENVINL